MDSLRLFGTNGIRGIVNRDLTPLVAVRVGVVVGTFFKRGYLVVGHDVRTSSSLLAHAVIAGLNAAGCNVLFADMVSTPALQFWVKRHRVAGGVMVTGSHNPAEYNGIKVIWKDGIELSREQETRIESMYFTGRSTHASWKGLGMTQRLNGVVDDHVAAVRKHIDVRAIRKKHYRIVVDPANSVGGLMGSKLLKELGCEVTGINMKLDGTFPGRLPEPRPENLGDLSSTVRAGDADLGVAFDSDADRAIFSDEKGEIAVGDRSFALVEKFFLKGNPGEKIVTSVSSSTMVKDIAAEYGGEIIWTSIGSVTVSRTMKKMRAKLGGEEYGGIFYGPHQSVRDAAMATSLILDIMAETGEKLSDLFGELPRYFISKDRVECPEHLKKRVLNELRKEVEDLEVSTLDGVKIWFMDKSAILVRPSGTEPVYRLYAEAKTAEKAKRLVSEYKSRVAGIIEKLNA